MSTRLLPLCFTVLLGACSGSDEPAGEQGDLRAKSWVGGGAIERVLIVSCDTLRADRLGLYGHEGGTSPRLDAFARSALVFDEAYSTTSLTHPAMSALMTGRMPDEIGMAGGNRQQMPAEVTTLAEVLDAAGIATAAIVSNWVLRSSQDTPEGTPDIGIAQGFQHFDDDMDVRELNRNAYERAAPDTTDAAIDWISGRAVDEPFFLWVHYQDPHGPYLPPEELVGELEPEPGDARLKVGKTHSGFAQLPNYQVIEGERQPAFYRARYDAEIRYFDREVGRLFDWLADEELLEGALILFTADHGESLGEHDFWFCHGESITRELVRVPLVVRSPVTRPGRTSRIAGHLDVFATVLEAFALPAVPSRGTSLLDPDSEAASDRVLVQTLFQRDSIARLEAVSDGRWRLVERRNRALLFDTEADPGEGKNLAAANPEIVRGLKRRAKQFWRNRPGAVVEQGPEAPLDPESARALEALGYLDGEQAEEELE